jgi:predicted porin
MQLAVNNDNNFTNMTNRQSFVGVKKNGLGQAAIGTQYTPIHLAVAATDPGQANNVHGNLIYAVNSTTANSGQSIAYTVRANNAMTFATDKFAGFGVNAIYSNNNTDRTQLVSNYTTTNASAGGTTNNQAWGVGADYTWNKLYANAAYQVLKQETDGVLGFATMTAISSTVGTNQPTVNGTSAQTYAAATYDFGILKAYAQWINNKTSSNMDGNLFIKRTAQQLGVRSMITPTIESWASVGNGRYSAYGSSAPTANFTGYQLGANYLLSKRTNFYAIYGSSQTSTVNTAVANSTTANGAVAVNGAAGNSAYAVGIRHTF